MKELKEKIEKIICETIIVGDDRRIMNYEQAAINIVNILEDYISDKGKNK